MTFFLFTESVKIFTSFLQGSKKKKSITSVTVVN